MKYALGVAALAGVGSVAVGWLGSPPAAVFGVAACLVGCILVLVFAQLARAKPTVFLVPAQVLMWSAIVLFVAMLGLLFTSFFFGQPLPLKPGLQGSTPAPPKPEPPPPALNAALAAPDPATHPALLELLPDMVRIAGAKVELGIADSGSFLVWCKARGATASQCTDVLERTRRRQASVSTFDLDRHEVSRGNIVAWLNEWLGNQRAELDGGRVWTSEGHRLLAYPECHGVGGVVVRSGRLELEPASPEASRVAAACVTWQGARSFCEEHGKRLPTEAEWELAAAGPEKRALPWGSPDVISCSDAVFGRVPDGPCRDWAQGPDDIERPGLDLTAEGVRGLAGNVSEWVDVEAARPVHGTARGGSWGGLAADLHTAKLMVLDASAAVATVGFRCARSSATSHVDIKGG
jgi:formylglycine-generating enzyme required for sulfatase activity